MKPFEYLTLNGKLVLYPTRNCTDQIAAANIISRSIIGRQMDKENKLLIVIAQAKLPNGRTEEATGVVNIAANNGYLHGDPLANAWMKAETKAKRRAVLAITGLSLLDETELESIPGRNMEEAHTAHQITIEAATRPAPTEDEVEVLYRLAYDDDDPETNLDTLFPEWLEKKKHLTTYDQIEELTEMYASSLTNQVADLDGLMMRWNGLFLEQQDSPGVKAAFNRAKVAISGRGTK